MRDVHGGRRNPVLDHHKAFTVSSNGTSSAQAKPMFKYLASKWYIACKKQLKAIIKT